MIDNIDGLTCRSVREYHLSPIPGPDDELLRRFVTAARSLPSQEYGRITDDIAWRLLTWAQRAATLAVRESAVERIREGLAALMIEGGRVDLSDSLATAALLFDAASRLNFDPVILFDEAANINPDTQLAQDLHDFCRRPYEEITLEAWGYGTTIEAGRFSYKRRW